MNTLAFVFLGFGAIFIVLGGIGLIRMPTLFMRMQATSKASTLGVILMTIGLAIHLPGLETVLKSVVIGIFLLLTVPIATHAIALAAEKKGSAK